MSVAEILDAAAGVESCADLRALETPPAPNSHPTRRPVAVHKHPLQYHLSHQPASTNPSDDVSAFPSAGPGRPLSIRDSAETDVRQPSTDDHPSKKTRRFVERAQTRRRVSVSRHLTSLPATAASLHGRHSIPLTTPHISPPDTSRASPTCSRRFLNVDRSGGRSISPSHT